MKTIAAELNNVIDKHLSGLQAMPESKYTYKHSPRKWSKKEILGHLVDSAQNNIRRFIVAQYEDCPRIVYSQDDWVSITNYQEYSLPDLISLWYLLNKHICHVLRYVPENSENRESETSDLHSIRWLAQDYIRHLLHHLHQVLELEPVVYP